MESLQSVIWNHLETLAGQIGPRPVGSAPNLAATEYIAQTLVAAGYPVERQEYPCPDWTLSGARLELDGLEVPAIVNPFSPACDRLEAPLAVCGTLTELHAAGLAGKIAVVHGGLARNALTPSYACYVSEPDPVAEALKQARPAAVVMVHSRFSGFQPMIEDWNFPIPSLTVGAEAGLRLVRAAGRTACLSIFSTRRESCSANLVARLPGRRPERVAVCAHFDTKFGTPGAQDNASGAAILLALAQAFAGQTLDSGLEFIAFNGEEASGTDFTAYLQRSPDFERILALVNLDGLGTRTGSPGYVAMGAAPELDADLDRWAADFSGLVKTAPWVESDHSMFVFRGVPAIPLTTAGGPEILHSPADNLNWLDPDRLDEVARFTQKVIEELSIRPMEACRL